MDNPLLCEWCCCVDPKTKEYRHEAVHFDNTRILTFWLCRTCATERVEPTVADFSNYKFTREDADDAISRG
jgi:hypothetical protein